MPNTKENVKDLFRRYLSGMANQFDHPITLDTEGDRKRIAEHMAAAATFYLQEQYREATTETGRGLYIGWKPSMGQILNALALQHNRIIAQAEQGEPVGPLDMAAEVAAEMLYRLRDLIGVNTPAGDPNFEAALMVEEGPHPDQTIALLQGLAEKLGHEDFSTSEEDRALQEAIRRLQGLGTVAAR